MSTTEYYKREFFKRFNAKVAEMPLQEQHRHSYEEWFARTVPCKTVKAVKGALTRLPKGAVVLAAPRAVGGESHTMIWCPDSNGVSMTIVRASDIRAID